MPSNQSPSLSGAIVAGLLGGLIVFGPVAADTLLVRPDGSGDHLTIQAAVDAASDDDVIVVGAGTYLEAVEVEEKSITIRAEKLGAATIDGEDVRRPLRLSGGSTITLEGLTIVRGQATEGGGIFVNFGTTALLTDCTIDDCEATVDHGGAIYLGNNTDLALVRCAITDNRAARYGGGIYLDYGGDVEASETVFTDNRAGAEGGGAWVYGGQAEDAPRFVDCDFEDNTVETTTPLGYGGGLRIRYGPVLLDRCDFLRNEVQGGDWASRFGGGVHFGSVTDATVVRDCTFEDNRAGRAGAIYLTAGTIQTSTFESNRSNWLGGAVEATNVTFLGNTFRSNVCTMPEPGADLGGGALHLSGDCTLQDCTFEGDHLLIDPGELADEDGGGAIRMADATVSITAGSFDGCFMMVQPSDSAQSTRGAGGGAIHATGGRLTITGGTTFTNCRAELLHDPAEKFGGGAIHALSCELAIDGATFTGNEVVATDGVTSYTGDGGAIRIDVQDGSDPATTTITGTTFDSNRLDAPGGRAANGSGGALYATDTIDLSGCLFVDNQALERPAIASRRLAGGAAAFVNATVSISGSTFLRNEASASDGAILLSPSSTATIDACDFQGHGSDEGAAISGIAGLVLSSTSMCDNGPTNLTAFGWTDGGGNDLAGRCQDTPPLLKVPEDHPTILSALRHAIHGDTIEIGPGIWTESIDDFGRDLDWVGRDGAAATIIDLGGATARCLDASSASSGRRVEGFTFRNAVTDQTLGPGAGLRVSDGISVTGCVFENLEATGSDEPWTRGGAVAAISNLVVVDCVFTNCRTSSNDGGGAIGVTGGGLAIDDSGFTGCTSTTSAGRRGGGAIMATGTQGLLTDCTFVDNTAFGGDGGALLADFDTLSISATSFDGNQAANDGGSLSCEGHDGKSPSVTIDHCDFRDGTAGDDGGGIATMVSTDIVTSRFERNTAGSDGGGIHSGFDLSLLDLRIEDNDAGRDGGGITAFGTLEVNQSQLDRNLAAARGGGLRFADGTLLIGTTSFDENDGENGGGLSIDSTVATLDSVDLKRNTAFRAGGLLAESSTLTMTGSSIGESTASDDAGGLKASGCSLVLIEVELVSNVAGGRSGGGLITNSTLIAEGCSIRSNQAAGDGGGLLLDLVDTPIFEDTSFTTNVAGGDGGGLRLTRVLGENGCRLLRCELLGNAATGAGGGLRTDEVATKVTVVDGIIGENQAEVGAGINSFDTRQLTLQNVAVYNNHASLFGGGLYDEGYGGGLQETVINESTISGNTAGAVGGGIYLLLREMAISNTGFCGNDPGQIIGFWTDYGGNTFQDGTCFFDCNGNGIEDGTEIGEGQLEDCDENGVPDLCEIADGSAEDCDGDGIPDVCTKGGFVTATSGTLPAFGVGVPQALPLTGTPAAGGPVTITVEAIGDLSGELEFGLVTVNDVEVGTLFETGEDCGDDALLGSLVVDAEIFNMLTVAGPAEIAVTGSIAVDADFCPDGSTRITIDYLRTTDGDCNDNGLLDQCEIAGGLAEDCNGNGVPDDCEVDDGMATDCNANGQLDACEIAAGDVEDENGDGIPDNCQCPFDLDGDGLVGGGDIGVFLGLWGTDDPAGDFDGDGEVRASDLGLLLAAFGACP